MYKQNLVSVCFPSGIFILFRFIYNRFVFLMVLVTSRTRSTDFQIRRFTDQISGVQVSRRSRRRNKELRVIKIYNPWTPFFSKVLYFVEIWLIFHVRDKTDLSKFGCLSGKLTAFCLLDTIHDWLSHLDSLWKHLRFWSSWTFLKPSIALGSMCCHETDWLRGRTILDTMGYQLSFQPKTAC